MTSTGTTASRPRRLHAGVAAAAALALVLTACSSKASDGEGGVDDEGVAMGPGVTEDTVTVGLMTDMTNVYAALGKSLTQAQQLYFQQVNEDGGICGRQVEVVVRDHGYDVQQAVANYTEISSDVAAFPQFLGSPMVMAVKDRIGEDHVLTIPQAWSTALLGSQYIQVTGTTYDVDMINAVQFLMEDHGIESGDAIGHVYFEGDYGESALHGAVYAAETEGIQLVEQRITSSDTDMTAAVSALEDSDVDAVLMSAGPEQSASLASVAAARGMDVPIVASNSGFAPQLLETPAAEPLLENFYSMNAGLPIAADVDEVQRLADDYSAAYPEDPLDTAVISGYSSAVLIGDALRTACENGDLTRDGITSAHRSQSQYDNPYGVDMDLSIWDASAARQSHVLKPDADAVGGLVVHKEAFGSEMLENYVSPVG
ncbi:ABC-type branched-subunit amino acid transport system substrate-binding protein [Spinactinospora alkalitolerans]|uniref:ABC-type branched-subunit amino acid transport system substrate-binding protein n=1 Tax=Spinactinospora alkalitolerans TaxID=687207 RepID=A0A852TVP7_9ACTN|nr:ABC transporter substrate-binding protein [Spinactinospora alkalitolerans]NYE48089.1 ABC-type branched-subunit amino acid transport system substrate-binding protein [Spinactinospora alkalitolerans]